MDNTYPRAQEKADDYGVRVAAATGAVEGAGGETGEGGAWVLPGATGGVRLWTEPRKTVFTAVVRFAGEVSNLPKVIRISMAALAYGIHAGGRE